MLTIPVPLGQRSYDVIVGELGVDAIADTLIKALGNTTGIAVLVDCELAKKSARVAELYQALQARIDRVARLDLLAGEACKSFSQLENTCEWLAAQGFDRGASIVSIGGGATSDHAGFAAAIYLRGIAFALIPTTLLAMVDASVGGKTAVDLRAGKNLVGAFYQPRVVLADLTFLDTLPPRELAAGMAEVVKAGLIADAGLFRMLEALSGPAHTWSRQDLLSTIAAAINVKVAVVTEDEREMGRRAILNFGHTLGHAMETASNYQLLHGEAVGLGMLAALRLGELRGTTEAGLLARTTALLQKLALPKNVQLYLREESLKHLEVDKKRRNENIRFVFVPTPGEAVLQDVALATLRTQVPTLFA